MKKISRLLVLILLLNLLLTSSSFATAESIIGQNIFLTSARVINNETGAVTNTNVTMGNAIQTYNFDGSITVSGEATLVLPVSSGGIQPFADGAGSKTEYSVKAYASINYNLQGDKIRVNSVTGYWEPQAVSMYMTNREVWLYAGIPMAAEYVLSKEPQTDSFYYESGWGYVLKYPHSQTALSGPRCFTSAVAKLSGMTASYTIELLVTV